MDGTAENVKLRKLAVSFGHGVGLLARATEYRAAGIIERSTEIMPPPPPEGKLKLHKITVYNPHDDFRERLHDMVRTDQPKTMNMGLLRWAQLYRDHQNMGLGRECI